MHILACMSDPFPVGPAPHPRGVAGPRPTRRTLLRSVSAALALPATGGALAGCTYASERLAEETNAVPDVDLSGIEEQPEIAALVPGAIRERGELVNGAATNYPPGEFLSNGVPVGYDIDMLAAIGRVLGLDTRTESAVFAQIIPSVGTKYDVGISSFTVSPDRLESVTMISYFQAGMAYAVKTGNPYGVDPHHLCGTKPAVQVGTSMEEMAYAAESTCRADGQRGVEVLSYASNSDAATNVAGGKADLLISDSPVVAYAIARSRGTLEQVGGIDEAALSGIVVAKDDPELAEALRAAVQYLIDSGHLRAIFAAWGNESGMIETAEVNPA